jgi:hypothetical protein
MIAGNLIPHGATVIELGSVRSVFLVDGKRQVVRYTPSRHWQDVLGEYSALRQGSQGGTAVFETPGSDAPLAVRSLATRRMLSAAEAPNVLNDPLLRVTGDHGRVGNISVRLMLPEDVSRPSLGQYLDYRGKRRSLPQLSGLTIKGLLVQPGALDRELNPSEDDLMRIARDGSDYRRAHGKGGLNCCPESAELYVRIFRALNLTPAEAERRDADNLQAVYVAYLQRYAS